MYACMHAYVYVCVRKHMYGGVAGVCMGRICVGLGYVGGCGWGCVVGGGWWVGGVGGGWWVVGGEGGPTEGREEGEVFFSNFSSKLTIAWWVVGGGWWVVGNLWVVWVVWVVGGANAWPTEGREEGEARFSFFVGGAGFF